MRELDDYLKQVKNLPPAPAVLPELLQLLNKEDVDSSKVVTLISYDPGLTASVLQLCNSAAFGTTVPVDDLNEAVTRVGFNRVYQLVAATVGARTLARTPSGYGIGKGELWKHSVTAAVAAQLIARRRGEPESAVYTATLLHDIGKIVLSEAITPVYLKLLEDTSRDQKPLIDAETAFLGVNHAQVGGRLLGMWRFPSSLVDAVTFHHAPSEAGPHARLASYVYVGNMLAHFMGPAYGHLPFAVRGRVEALQALDLRADDLPVLMIETFEQLSLIETLFRVAD